MHGKPNLTFLTEAAARPEPGDAVFRERRTSKFLAAALLMAACVGAASATWLVAAQDHLHIVVTLFFSQTTAMLFVVFLIALRGYRVSGRPDNWLLRATPQGLFVHYRSHLSGNLPADRQTVAFLPRHEIEWIRANRWKHGPNQQDLTVSERRDFLEVALHGADLSIFEKRLSKEHRLAKEAKSRHEHRPVELAGNVIRIEWRSPRTFITPGLDKALEFLKGSYRLKEATYDPLSGDEEPADPSGQQRP